VAEQRTVVVTGAASGIGLAVVARLVRRGCHVIALDVRPCPLDGCEWIECDLGNRHSVADAFVGLAVPVAGVAAIAGVSGLDAPRRILQVNWLGTRRVIKDVLTLLEPGGSIVTMASISADPGPISNREFERLVRIRSDDDIVEWLSTARLTGNQAYRLSKAVVTEWARRLSVELLPRRIRVNSVSPGPVRTPLLGAFEESMGRGIIARAERITGRHATSDEVAAVVEFLLSAESTWVNGVDIRVDGGLMTERSLARRKRTWDE
jgi:NAD(P)-dependent dehydrogenase (short-subunit alcohol dehydrogenase family)